MLRRLDPDAARKIAPADEQKLIRAIEVCLLTKRPLTEVYREGRTPLEGGVAVKIGLNPHEKLLRTNSRENRIDVGARLARRSAHPDG